MMFLAFFLIVMLFASLLLFASVFVDHRSHDPDTSYAWSYKLFCLVGLIVLWVWLATYFFMPVAFGAPNGAGTAGDMFGGTTSLFSGLAFAGIVSTILVQRKDLEFQRQELRFTRQEFVLQRFESTLFSILSLFTDHIENLSLGSGEGELRGRAVLDSYASELTNALAEPTAENPMEEVYRFADLNEQISDYMETYGREFETDLGPYFRLLYNAIRHIEKSDLDEALKPKYSKIVRAHLSSSEVKLLMYNGLSDLGSDFKPWIEKYELLTHVRAEDKNYNASIAAAYAPAAFGH